MNINEKPSVSVMGLFEMKKSLKICAPMVRYSKLQFRNLVKLYDCDLVFTPMIIADSFCKSEQARQNEFTTNSQDVPVITQFAANTVHDFVTASYLVSPFCNGVDLNCGCPQRWAERMELGCSMLKNPEKIYDLVTRCRNQIPKPFTVSVKMRLLNNIQQTVEICRQLEKCGISFITVHARTSDQITGFVNKEALKQIKSSCDVPIVANGGIYSLNDYVNLQADTGCDGVMVANGILNNPTLFSGQTMTSIDCIQNWLDICYNSTVSLSSYEKEVTKPEFILREKSPNLTFQCFHHHLVFMLEKILPKTKRRVFNNLKKFTDVLDFIKIEFGLKPRLFEFKKFLQYLNIPVDYNDKIYLYNELKPVIPDNQLKDFIYSYSNDGKYFENKISPIEESWSDIFLETN